MNSPMSGDMKERPEVRGRRSEKINLRGPGFRAFDGFPPDCAALGSFAGTDCRFKSSIHLPVGHDRFTRRPKPDRQAGEIRRAQRGGFSHLRTNHGKLAQIGLDLQQRVVDARAAIDAEFGEFALGIIPHAGQEVGDLQGDTFQRRAGDVAGRRAARDADDRSPGRGIPIGGTQPGERGDKRHASIVGNRVSERFDVCGSLDDAQTIAEPADRGPADEDRTFEGVFGGRAKPPSDRGQQFVLRSDCHGPSVHQHEAARAISVLGPTGGKTILSEERRLLIARDAREFDSTEWQVRRHFAVDFARGTNLRHDFARHVQQPKQFVVPIAGVDVHEQRPRGVRSIGDVGRAAGQVPSEPGIDRSAGEAIFSRRLSDVGIILNQPGDFRSREVWVEQQAGLVAESLFVAGAFQFVTRSARAPVLPNDGVRERRTCGAVPGDNGFALVGDADGRDVGRLELQSGQDFDGHSELRRPDFLGVVLHPTGLGVVLFKLALSDGQNCAAFVENNGTRRGRALIEGQEVSHGSRPKAVFIHEKRVS
jgi:hypothetical protein